MKGPCVEWEYEASYGALILYVCEHISKIEIFFNVVIKTAMWVGVEELIIKFVS